MAKRNGSAVVAIAKDEDPYILEWLAYHLAIGVDHIWIYDNGSRIPVASMLSERGSWRRVTVIPWKDIPGEDSQHRAYEHFLRTYGHAVEWTAVIDVDEFICLPQQDSINDFLDGFGHANGICINWRYFGSSGQTHHRPGLLMERFTRATPVLSWHNTGIKSIYRTAEVKRLVHHFSETKGSRRVYSADGTLFDLDDFGSLPIKESNFAIAQINHYFVKSKEEWERKIKRGYSWSEQEDRSRHFELCDVNEVEDRSILRWKRETERWIRKLAAPQRHAIFSKTLDAALRPMIRRLRQRMVPTDPSALA